MLLCDSGRGALLTHFVHAIWPATRGAFCEMLFWYLQEVNKTPSYLRRCWGRGFGLSMDMASRTRSHWAVGSSPTGPTERSRIGMSKRFVLTQDQSLLVFRSRSKSRSSCRRRRWRRPHCWAKWSSCRRSETFARALRDSTRRAECLRWDSTTVD